MPGRSSNGTSTRTEGDALPHRRAEEHPKAARRSALAGEVNEDLPGFTVEVGEELGAGEWGEGLRIAPSCCLLGFWTHRQNIGA
jgi:hypothetical protein